MINLLKVNVFTDYDIENVVNNGEIESLEKPEDIKYIKDEVDCDWDYAQTALIDIDKNEILYWNDNIHDDPDKTISDFTDGLKYAKVEFSLITGYIYDKDLRENYTGVKY